MARGKWSIAPEHLDETLRALQEISDIEGVALLLHTQDGWLPLLELQANDTQIHEWKEPVDAISIEGSISTTLYFLDGVEPGPVRVQHDEQVDGILLWIGEKPVVAVAGPRMSRLPEGLLHLEGAELSWSSLELAASQVGNSLRSLDVGGNEALGSRAPSLASSFPKLEGFDLRGIESIQDLTPLANLSQLRRLNLEGCSSLSDLAALSSLSTLTHLDLSDCSAIESLAALRSLTSLISLDLSGCDRLQSLEPLVGLSTLSLLGLADCAQLPDLAPLARVPSLSSLDLSGCSSLLSVQSIRDCPNLHTLSVLGCSRITDLHVLTACSPLRILEADDDVMVARVLAGCAVARVDPDYVRQRIESWFALVDRPADGRDLAMDLLPALSLGFSEPWAVSALHDLIDRVKRSGIEDQGLWTRIFISLRLVGDPGWRPSIERALEDLVLGDDSLSILEPALEALGQISNDSFAGPWARTQATLALDSLIGTPQARRVAKVAVKYYACSRNLSGLDAWIEVLLASSPQQQPASHQTLTSARASESDFTVLAPLVARLAQKQPDSPEMRQVLAVIVGMVRDRPEALSVDPLVVAFEELIEKKPDCAAVGRLWKAFERLLLTAAPASIIAAAADTILHLIRKNPDNMAFEPLMQEMMDWVVEHPQSPVVERFTALLDAARDSGLVSFSHTVLSHATLRAHASEELREYVSAFDLRQARRAMIRGILDELCAQDIVRNKPRAQIAAAIEEDFG